MHPPARVCLPQSVSKAKVSIRCARLLLLPLTWLLLFSMHTAADAVRMNCPWVTARSHEQTTGPVLTFHRQSESRPSTRTEARPAIWGSHEVVSWPESADQDSEIFPQALLPQVPHLPACRKGCRRRGLSEAGWKLRLRGSA